MKIKTKDTRNTRPGYTFALCSLLSLSTSACSSSDSAPLSNDSNSRPLAHTVHASTPASSEEANDGTSTSALNSASDKFAEATNLKLPENFSAYASEPIGDGKLCIVGASTDDDGMNQKPFVYVARPNKHLMWVTQLGLPANTYQGRATHCSRSEGALLVLLQSDTQTPQTMSQTLLRVEKMDVLTGSIKENRDIDLANAYTAWVNEGASNFQWKTGVLTISGNYRTESDKNSPIPFTLHLNGDLNP